MAGPADMFGDGLGRALRSLRLDAGDQLAMFFEHVRLPAERRRKASADCPQDLAMAYPEIDGMAVWCLSYIRRWNRISKCERASSSTSALVTISTNQHVRAGSIRASIHRCHNRTPLCVVSPNRSTFSGGIRYQAYRFLSRSRSMILRPEPSTCWPMTRAAPSASCTLMQAINCRCSPITLA